MCCFYTLFYILVQAAKAAAKKRLKYANRTLENIEKRIKIREKEENEIE